jgi:hypothetical protein
MALAHNIIATLCCVMSWICFVIGCIGNSQSTYNVKNAPWIRISSDSYDIYAGTQNLVYHAAGDDTNLNYAHSCTGTFCDDCKDNGRVTFPMMCVAVISTMVGIVLCAVCCANNNSTLKWVTTANTLLFTVFSVVAWSVFIRRCGHALDEASSGAIEYGAAGALVLLGFLLAAITLTMNILNLMEVESGATARPVPTADEAKPVEA